MTLTLEKPPQLEGAPSTGRSSITLGGAQAALARGDFQEAAHLAGLLVEQNPGSFAAWQLLGVALARIGRLADSVRAFEQCVTIEPFTARSHFNLGNALLQNAELERAREAFSQALALDSSYQRASEGLHRVHRSLGLSSEQVAGPQPRIAAGELPRGGLTTGNGGVQNGLAAAASGVNNLSVPDPGANNLAAPIHVGHNGVSDRVNAAPIELTDPAQPFTRLFPEPPDPSGSISSANQALLTQSSPPIQELVHEEPPAPSKKVALSSTSVAEPAAPPLSNVVAETASPPLAEMEEPPAPAPPSPATAESSHPPVVAGVTGEDVTPHPTVADRNVHTPGAGTDRADASARPGTSKRAKRSRGRGLERSERSASPLADLPAPVQPSSPAVRPAAMQPSSPSVQPAPVELSSPALLTSPEELTSPAITPGRDALVTPLRKQEPADLRLIRRLQWGVYTALLLGLLDFLAAYNNINDPVGDGLDTVVILFHVVAAFSAGAIAVTMISLGNRQKWGRYACTGACAWGIALSALAIDRVMQPGAPVDSDANAVAVTGARLLLCVILLIGANSRSLRQWTRRPIVSVDTADLPQKRLLDSPSPLLEVCAEQA